jgi:hypothetical protein
MLFALEASAASRPDGSDHAAPCRSLQAAVSAADDEEVAVIAVCIVDYLSTA